MLYDDNLHIHRYDKLGITGARKELRKLFLDSEYDYIENELKKLSGIKPHTAYTELSTQ